VQAGDDAVQVSRGSVLAQLDLAGGGFDPHLDPDDSAELSADVFQGRVGQGPGLVAAALMVVGEQGDGLAQALVLRVGSGFRVRVAG